MSTFVKICGLRDSNGVAAAVEAGADAIGFVFAFEKSPRVVSVAEALEAARAAPPHVLRVAVMLHPAAEAWNEVRDEFAPDVLQTDLEDFSYLDVPDYVTRWPVIREGDAISEWPDEFVYEGRKSGAGESVDWQKARAVADKGRMVLAGGLDSGNVIQAINTARPFGVDVSSGVESAPGIKDPGLIREFIGTVRAAENEG